jgi:hypothetical protein
MPLYRVLVVTKETIVREIEVELDGTDASPVRNQVIARLYDGDYKALSIDGPTREHDIRRINPA